MKNSLLISILVLVLTSCNRFICESRQKEFDNKGSAGMSLFETSDVKKFQTFIKFRKAEMSGMLIVKRMNDTVLAGSFINEFGIKGFDFDVYPSDIRFIYMIRKLDKWYIKKTLGNDLHFMLLRPEMKNTCNLGGEPVFVNRVNKTLAYIYPIANTRKNEMAIMFRKHKRFAEWHQISDDNGLTVIRMDHLKGSRSYELKEIKN
jgi:hypothetical protein